MKLWSVKKEYIQEGDTNSFGDQVLTLETASGDLEGPDYVILSTERWAMCPEEIPELIEMLVNFSNSYVRSEERLVVRLDVEKHGATMEKIGASNELNGDPQ